MRASGWARSGRVSRRWRKSCAATSRARVLRAGRPRRRVVVRADAARHAGHHRHGQPAFALWAAGLQSGSTTAADAMDSGLPAWRSGIVGMTDGMIEAITEMAPAFKFVESMKVGDSFARFFGKQLMTELPGELLATLGQEYNAWAAGLRGDADLGEWVRTLPEAQAQTVIATLTMVALTSGLGRGAVRLLQDRKAAEEAPQKAERLRELFELSSASALRQRAPETFAEFVDQAAADGQQTLYLDAEALAQSVRQMPPEELERALPGAAEQLARGERWVSVPLGAAMAACQERRWRT